MRASSNTSSPEIAALRALPDPLAHQDHDCDTHTEQEKSPQECGARHTPSASRRQHGRRQGVHRVKKGGAQWMLIVARFPRKVVAVHGKCHPPPKTLRSYPGHNILNLLRARVADELVQPGDAQVLSLVRAVVVLILRLPAIRIHYQVSIKNGPFRQVPGVQRLGAAGPYPAVEWDAHADLASRYSCFYER